VSGRERQRETETERDRETDRQRARAREKERERERERKREGGRREGERVKALLGLPQGERERAAVKAASCRLDISNNIEALALLVAP
jgi:hypothetical protein